MSRALYSGYRHSHESIASVRGVSSTSEDVVQCSRDDSPVAEVFARSAHCVRLPGARLSVAHQGS